MTKPKSPARLEWEQIKADALIRERAKLREIQARIRRERKVRDPFVIRRLARNELAEGK